MRALAFTLLVAISARAGECRGSDAQARLQLLSQTFQREEASARRWTLGWATAYGVLTVGQVAAAPAFSRSDQPDWYWGAGSTAVAVAAMVVNPLAVLDFGPSFVQRAAAPGADACALVAEGDRLLEGGAAQERSNRAWYAHLVNVVFNLGVGLLLGLAYQHWLSGAASFVVGAALGEATLLTSPTGLIDALERDTR